MRRNAEPWVKARVAFDYTNDGDDPYGKDAMPREMLTHTLVRDFGQRSPSPKIAFA